MPAQKALEEQNPHLKGHPRLVMTTCSAFCRWKGGSIPSPAAGFSKNSANPPSARNKPLHSARFAAALWRAGLPQDFSAQRRGFSPGRSPDSMPRLAPSSRQGQRSRFLLRSLKNISPMPGSAFFSREPRTASPYGRVKFAVAPSWRKGKVRQNCI